MSIMSGRHGTPFPCRPGKKQVEKYIMENIRERERERERERWGGWGWGGGGGMERVCVRVCVREEREGGREGKARRDLLIRRGRIRR
jgi:hypothetical protein